MGPGQVITIAICSLTWSINSLCLLCDWPMDKEDIAKVFATPFYCRSSFDWPKVDDGGGGGVGNKTCILKFMTLQLNGNLPAGLGLGL